MYQIYHISIQMIFFFFFNDTATTEIYTLSLHDALPISHAGDEPPVDLHRVAREVVQEARGARARAEVVDVRAQDRKSTRLNSSHANISYAVFCLKKKNKDPDYQSYMYHTTTNLVSDIAT